MLLFGLNVFGATENPCEKNEDQGLSLVAESIAPMVEGIPVYTDDFNVRIFHISKSGDGILSVSGMLSLANESIAINGLLECNKTTGEYEFAGAGTSRK
jgi:hypothetical protein